MTELQAGKVSLRGLYAITDPHLMNDHLLSMAEQAIKGGIKILQYRNKHAPLSQQQAEAQQLAGLCHQHGVIFLVNDNIELAMKSHADGVHLGQQDTDIKTARAKLGDSKIIGITCHDSIEKALAAQNDGADYVAFGRFFASSTKPEAPAADSNLISKAKKQLTIPMVAIGGINAQNAAGLLAQGADMLAVIHGIFGQPDIYQATKNLHNLFSHT